MKADCRRRKGETKKKKKKPHPNALFGCYTQLLSEQLPAGAAPWMTSPHSLALPRIKLKPSRAATATRSFVL